jgi:hypothetical protein
MKVFQKHAIRLKEGNHAMFIAIYALLLLASSSILGLLGFFVGRCARKLPIIDSYMPWTIHQGGVPTVNQKSQSRRTPVR